MEETPKDDYFWKILYHGEPWQVLYRGEPIESFREAAGGLPGDASDDAPGDPEFDELISSPHLGFCLEKFYYAPDELYWPTIEYNLMLTGFPPKIVKHALGMVKSWRADEKSRR